MLEILTPNQLLAKHYLEELNFKDISTKNKTLTMSKPFIVNGKPTEILITLSQYFPLEYPSFYIKDTSLFLLYPHLQLTYKYSDACSICLIKEEDKKLSNLSSDLILNEMINRLEQYILELNNGQLQQVEIFDEFEHYWDYPLFPIPIIHYNEDCFHEKIKIKLLDIYFSKNLAIIDENRNIDNFFKTIDVPYKKAKILFINFDKYFPHKIPTSYDEFLAAIQIAKIMPSFKKLKKSILFPFILFSFKHPSSKKKIFATLYIEKQNQNIPILVSLLNKNNENKRLIGGTAKNINLQRIYTRGGNNINMKVNEKAKKIAIIGCGSVGASLALKLLKSGFSNFLLVDKQTLSVDNIGRHLLGMEYVNTNKAQALKNFMLKQLIGLKIETIESSIHENIDTLKNCDLIISALGNDATHIEEHLIQNAINGDLPPIISCWLEADAIAGHAVLFDLSLKDYQNLNGFFDINYLFSNINILDSNFAQSLKKDDVGCNATYMPYSFLNADLHINHFVNMIISFILKQEVKHILSSISNIENINEHLKSPKSVRSYTVLQSELP